MKDDILKILLDNMSRYVSGEHISTALGISRSAVWKYMKMLKQEGCGIDSVPNKGYCLVYLPDRICGAVIQYYMSTKWAGRNAEIHETIDSTNARAKELARNGAEHGMLIVSDCQNKGRGRLGRCWISPPGTGIYMSLVLRPKFPPYQAHFITVMAALSIANAIQAVAGVRAGIKWPNDIIVNSKKVCGILTEIQAEPDITQYVVLGAGINVNNVADDFPDELAASASSVRLESGKAADRNRIIASVLDNFESLFDSCESSGDFGLILDLYRKKCITLGKRVKVFCRTEEFEGYAEGLSDNSELMVRLDDGSVRRVIAGDVSVRGIAGYV